MPVMTAAATSTQRMSPATGVPCIRPREAWVRWVTGLWRTTAWIQLGIVEISTKMLLAKVSGMRNRKLVVITDSGVFTFMLKMIQIHEMANEKSSTRAN